MSTTTHDVINPATEETVRSIEPRRRRGDRRGRRPGRRGGADLACSRPRRPWPAAAPLQRGRRRPPRGASRLEVTNAGHTIGNARWEAGNVRDVLAYYSAAPERLFGRQIPVAGGLDITLKEPLGVVSVIVPWNFPMPIAGWGFAPALAAGNTVVLKPAEAHPAHRDATRRAWRSRRASPRACSPSCRARARSWGSGSSPTPTSARSASPARPPWARGSCARPRTTKRVTLEPRWQVRQHRLRRRRP